MTKPKSRLECKVYSLAKSMAIKFSSESFSAQCEILKVANEVLPEKAADYFKVKTELSSIKKQWL